MPTFYDDALVAARGRFGRVASPERHEPDTGELNYPYLFSVIDEVAAQCGWQGWIGCEYKPARGAVPGGTTDGLGWFRKQLASSNA